MNDEFDAVVIGSGPNGLVAAALLARAGWSVAVVEGNEVAGGAVHSAELTVPGYVHDSCAGFFGVLHCSPVLTELELDRRVAWASLPKAFAAAAAPTDVALLDVDPEATATDLSRSAPADGPAWRALCEWWAGPGTRFLDLILGPIGAPKPALAFAAATARDGGPRGPLAAARMLVSPVATVAAERFVAPAARALFVCGASHADVAVDEVGSTPAALILVMAAQRAGMPVPVGGAGRLAAALADCVTEAGGQVFTGQWVTRVVIEKGRAIGVESATGTWRARRAVLADTGIARLFGTLVGEETVPRSFLSGVRRFRYGTGMFRVDLALDGPVPWSVEGLDRCAVVHLTGDLKAMARAAFEARHGQLPAEPMVIVGQQSVADPSRAPAGGHTLWLETHVPPTTEGGWPSSSDAFAARMIDRVEAHAPGLAARIKARAVRTPADLEAQNPNLVGGDVNGGSSALNQQLVFRPVPGWFRYATPVRGLYVCSASAHPGGGVHGMAGRNCARRVIRDGRLRRI